MMDAYDEYDLYWPEDSIEPVTQSSSASSNKLLNGFEEDTVLTALQTFKLYFGHVTVPLQFMIEPNSLCFPSYCGGMKLGSIMKSLRLTNDLKNSLFETRLRDLGVVFMNLPPLEPLYNAIKFYMSHVKSGRVPRDGYCIPVNSVEYDSSLWGCDLGKLAASIISGDLYPEHRERWLELKLPMKSRMLENRCKPRIIYDADHKLKCDSMRGRKVKADRKSRFPVHKASVSSKKGQSKLGEQKYVGSDFSHHRLLVGSDDLESVSLASEAEDNDTILGEIEASSTLPVPKKGFKRRHQVAFKGDYESCSGPLIQSILTKIAECRSLKNKIDVLSTCLVNMQFRAADRNFNADESSVPIVESLSSLVNKIDVIKSQCKVVDNKISLERFKLRKILRQFATEEILTKLIDGIKQNDSKTIEIWGCSSLTINALKLQLDLVQRYGTTEINDQIRESMISEAVQVYKAEYGPTIPKDYRVPNWVKYPMCCWQLKLGELLSQHAATEAQPRIQQFAMQFGDAKDNLIKKIVYSLDGILDATLVFHRLHHHGNISTNYIVPFGSKLYSKTTYGAKIGQWVSDVIVQATRLAQSKHEDRVSVGTAEMLINLWEVDSVTAIRHKLNSEISGDTHTDTSFGGLVHTIRKALQCCISDPNGIPLEFVVPKCNLYPTECWGLRLGVVVRTDVIRVTETALSADRAAAREKRLKMFTEQCDKLISQLVKIDDDTAIEPLVDSTREAKIPVEEVRGTVDVVDNDIEEAPIAIDTDEGDDTISSFIGPQELERIKLQIYHRRIVNFMKLPVESAYMHYKHAKRIYRRLHSVTEIPAEYVVAEDDEQYLAEVRGLPLGLFHQWLKCDILSHA